MKAIMICKRVVSKIKLEGTVVGYVHSVFNNACNIETIDQKLITLLKVHKPMAPMSITVELDTQELDFIKLNISVGMKFVLNEDEILCAEANVKISLKEVSLWDSKPDFSFLTVSQVEMEGNIGALEVGLNQYGKFDGIGPLIRVLQDSLSELNLKLSVKISEDKGFQFIMERFVNFITLITEGNINNISIGAKKILGFGQGLTPSVDDFISGLMLSLLYMHQYYKLDLAKIYSLNSEIVKEIFGRTTRVSTEMLIFASLGETTESVRSLILSLLSQNNKAEILRKTIKVIYFGETSGTDIAVGIYVGCKIMNIYSSGIIL